MMHTSRYKVGQLVRYIEGEYKEDIFVYKGSFDEKNENLLVGAEIATDFQNSLNKGDLGVVSVVYEPNEAWDSENYEFKQNKDDYPPCYIVLWQRVNKYMTMYESEIKSFDV